MTKVSRFDAGFNPDWVTETFFATEKTAEASRGDMMTIDAFERWLMALCTERVRGRKHEGDVFQDSL